MGVILSAFLLPKMAFWGDLGSFEGSDGKIVRSDCKNGSWVAKNAFSGCSLGIRGFTHVSPYNPDVVGSPTASVFHSIYVFSFQFLWYFPRVYVTLPQKLGLTNYSPL